MQFINSKREVLFGLILVMAVIAFSGCSTDKSDLKPGSSALQLQINVTHGQRGSLIQSVTDEFNLSQLIVKVKNQDTGEVAAKKEKSITGSGEKAVKFSQLTAETTYQVIVKVLDEQQFPVYQGSKPVTVSGDGDLVTIHPQLVKSNGLVIDFRHVPDTGGEVLLVPAAKEESAAIKTTLDRVNFNRQLPANDYQLQVKVDGEVVKIGKISLLPGRKTIAAQRIDLAKEVKNLGRIETKSGQPGPAIAVRPEGRYFIKQEKIRLNVSSRAEVARYTLDGSNPKAEGKEFSSGEEITIGSNMSVGETKTLKIYAADGQAISTASYKFTKRYQQINPTRGTKYKKSLNLGALPYQHNGRYYTSFRIWSPDSNDVQVTVYNYNNGQDKTFDCQKLNPFDEDDNDRFTPYTDVYDARVPGNLIGKKYQFKIDGEPVRDPYGVMVKPGTNKNVIVNVNQVNPADQSWHRRPDLAKREDAIIYEMHVRDFTIAENSGVEASKRGTFTGFVESGTSYQGAKTGIDHLKQLGVTHVQVMPIFDFGTQQYNWGYDPINYNVPEEQYSTVYQPGKSSYSQADYQHRIREVKTMVNQLHNQDLRVVMDVVYNHTYTKQVFGPITDKYYTEEDLSGCGNSIDSSRPMVRKMIRDSLEYWVSEYNIDGFRFDLMGIFDKEAVEDWAAYLTNKFPDRKLMLHGEPWATYGVVPKTGKDDLEDLTEVHVGAFNDQIRNAIIGSNNQIGVDERGYMFNKGKVNKIKEGLLASPEFTGDPEQTLNYVSAHDNYCLWDKIRLEWKDDDNYSMKNKSDYQYAKRIDKFAMGIIMTAQGVPFMHGGDEMLRTKLNSSATNREEAENSYNASDEVNKIDWSWKTQHDGSDENQLNEVFEYYRDLIQLRKNHRGFRFADQSAVEDNIDISTDRQNVVISKIDETGDEKKDLVVVYNAGHDYQVDLPAGTWQKIFDAGGHRNVTGISGSAMCKGTAVTVFARQ